MLFIPHSIGYFFFSMLKMFINLIIFSASKYIKMYQQEIPFTGHNVLEFFRMPLHTYYLSDLHKKFQMAFTYITNIEY